MVDWLTKSLAAGGVPSWDQLFATLALALLLGCAVAAVYWLTRRGQPPAHSFLTTLVLLAILIAMVTQVVGDNVARAFSLVGALSIVRFRTVVEDTRDTAFVILTVVVGMACGSGHLAVALVGLVVSAAAAALMMAVPECTVAATSATSARWVLTVRLGLGHNPDELLAGPLREHASDFDLLAASTGRQGAALDLTYQLGLRPGRAPTALVGALNRVEGVQSVELKRL